VQAEDTRRVPLRTGPEKETLEEFLDYHRDTLLWKISGLSDHDLRQRMVPSGTSLLGIVKHLGFVEQNWFFGFAGMEYETPVPWTDEDPDADFRIEPHETTKAILDFYGAKCAMSRQIVAAASLDDISKRKEVPPEGPPTLRWILIHMIEETARHNGHADILREQIDGATGA
jgi:uncharacterized damage-inducible protein DinB